MPRVRLRPEADRDLLELSTYIATDRPRAAKNWANRVDEVFVRLSEYPGLGRERPDLGEDLRSFPIMSGVIIYRRLSDGVEIVRVLHESRDLRAQF